MPAYLSPNFTLEEFTFSDTAARYNIDNSNPPPEVMERLLHTAKGMEQVKSLLLGHPIHINSGWRSPKLNAKVSKSKHSAHLGGDAADFTCIKFGNPIDIVKKIMESSIQFDQLIQEGTWVHISFAPAMRREVLTANFDAKGNATYTVGV
jgi:hypothetical protein